MPFDHNDHYHRLLLQYVPHSALTALDVGCGTGRFARRLAALGIEVDAVDPAAEAVDAARAAGGPVRYRQADITEVALPRQHYDYISCLASLHHMPFTTLAALRDALAPGGVLVVLGAAPETSRTDWAWSLAVVPVNAAARLAVAARDRVAGKTGKSGERVRAPVRQPVMPLAEVKREAAELLPGCGVRRLLFWRYLLVYRSPVG